MDLQEIEDHIIAHQAGLIRARFGEDAASNVNYGWGITELARGPVVDSKLYGHNLILTTSMNSDGTYHDSWEDYL